MMARFVSLVFLAVLACSSPTKNIDNPGSFTFGVQYLYTGETFYESVSVRDSTMTRTYFNDTGKCKQALRSPCWSQEDLLTTTADLSNDEVVGFKKLVEESGFMNSDPDPDAIAAKQRFYSYRISVTYKGATHQVITGSFPGSTSAPTAVRSIYRRLIDFSKQKKLGN
ncbi:MAG: hypothetical protein K8S54_19825 [Spirochaetia bacterium]|nr:hypothetical protein [Spirochaetia bacterium]